MSSVNKVVAIDIGGVCIQLHFDKFCSKLGVDWGQGGLPVEVQNIFSKFERGLCSEREWLDELHKVSSFNYSDDEMVGVWNTIIGTDIPGMAQVVSELVDLGYRFVFFSDTSRPHTLSIYEKLSFSHLITGSIFSFEVGACKPEEKMYSEFERKYGRPCFYLDDKPMNVDGGTAYGWTSHLFTNPDLFRQEFFRLVVETQE